MASKRANRLAPLRMTRAPAPVACPTTATATLAQLCLRCCCCCTRRLPSLHLQSTGNGGSQSCPARPARPHCQRPPLLLFASLSFSPSLCCSLPPSASFFPFLPLFCQFRFWFSKFVLQNGCTCKQMPRPPLPIPPSPLCLPLLAAIVGCVMRLSKFLAATAAPCLDSWLRLRRRLPCLISSLSLSLYLPLVAAVGQRCLLAS